MSRRLYFLMALLFAMYVIILGRVDAHMPCFHRKYLDIADGEKHIPKHNIEPLQNLRFDRRIKAIVSETADDAGANTSGKTIFLAKKTSVVQPYKAEIVTIKIKYRPQSARRSIEKAEPDQKTVEISERMFYNKCKKFCGG